jgi:hypothetical protein
MSAPEEESIVTTIFGPDISSYEAGLDLSRLADAAFVIAKVTEGTYYTDTDFPGWRAQAARISKPLVWYHFLSGEDATAQAKHTAAAVGSTSLPGMLDCEPEGSFKPSLAQIIAYVKAAHAVGLNLRLVYLPHWYWQQMGSPDLSELAALGVHLVSSAYPGGSGTAAQLYPGDGAAGWKSYGGMTPLLYQFTDKASDGGQQVDFNAFRGSLAELIAVLNGTTPSSGGTDMANNVIPASVAHHFPGLDLSADFPANAPFDEATADIWGDARAEAAWRYAQMADQKLDQLLARQAPTAEEIGTAVASHLSGGGGASAADIAAAVEHLFAQKLSA